MLIKLYLAYTAHRFYQKLGFRKDGENSGLVPYTLLLSQSNSRALRSDVEKND